MSKPLLKNSLYNPLTEAELNKFFSYVNLSHLTDEQQQIIHEMFKQSAEKNVWSRRLIREQNAPFHLTLSDEDMRYLFENGCTGFQATGENRIIVSLDEYSMNMANGTLLHEMRHRQQEAEKLWLYDNVREHQFIANKIMEAEAVSINCDVNKGYDSYYERLKDHNIKEISTTIKESEIPYADDLTAEEKKQARQLYIEAKATELTMAQNIALRMQPNGVSTYTTAQKFGLTPTVEEISSIEEWRKSYNNQANSSAYAPSIIESDITQEQNKESQYLYQYCTNRFPELKNLNFYQSGLTSEESMAYGFHTLPVQPIAEETKHRDNTTTHKKTIIHDNNTATTTIQNEQGQKIYQCHFNQNGLRHGQEIYYDKNGNEKILKNWENGLQNGLTKYHYDLPQTTENNPENASDDVIVRAEEYWQYGKKISSTLYNQKNEKTQEILSEDIDNLQIRQNIYYYEKGRPVTFISQEGSQSVIHKARYDDKTGKPISVYSAETDEQGHIVRTNLTSETNETTMLNILENTDTTEEEPIKKAVVRYSDGKIKGKGMAYSPKARIGVWTLYDKNGQSRKVCYTGKEVTTDTGKTIQEEMEIPSIELQKQGYIQHKDNPVMYTKRQENGLTDCYTLDENTGLIYSNFQMNKKEEVIGTAKIYRPNGTLLQQINYNDEGYQLSSTTYNKSGTRPTLYEEFDGTDVYATYYYGDGKTAQAEVHYNGETDKEYTRIEYYTNGNIKSQYSDKDDTTYTYTIEGNLKEKITNESHTEYYPESTDKNGNPAKKYETVTDEQGNSKIIRFRKDQSKLFEATINKDGNGSQVFYNIDGKTPRASGSVKGYDSNGHLKKDGVWIIGDSTTLFKDGIRTDREKHIAQLNNPTIALQETNKSGGLKNILKENAQSYIEQEEANQQITHTGTERN